MGKLMVNLAMDESIRGELIKFIREQVRPLIHDVVIEQKGVAQKLADKLLTDERFRTHIAGVFQNELRSWSNLKLRDFFTNIVREEVQIAIEQRIKPTLHGLVRAMVKEELRSMLSDS